MPGTNDTPQSLGDAYGKARTLSALTSSLLLFSVYAGVGLDHALPFLNVTIENPEKARLVLAFLTTYAFLHTTIEWFQADPKRRQRKASLADFGLTTLLTVFAVGAYASQTFDGSFLTATFIAAGLGLGIGGVVAGVSVGTAIWSFRFVRSPDTARRLALPRVPVAVATALTMAVCILVASAVALLAWRLASPQSFLQWAWVYVLCFGLVVVVEVAELALPTKTLKDGSKVPSAEFARRVGEVYALHDTIYRQHGGMLAESLPPSPLFEASAKGDLREVTERLMVGDDPNQREQFGWTSLMIATANQHTSVVKELLNAGADPNLYNTQGRTALMFAARYGHLELVKLLLDARADPNIDRFRHEPLALAAAAANGHASVVQILLASGADPLSRDLNGDTALDLAQRNQRGEVARILRTWLRQHNGRT